MHLNSRFLPTVALSGLFVLAGLVLLAAPSEALAQKKNNQPRWAKMDLGPTFSSTISGRGVSQVPKGLAIRVGDQDQAAVLFDIDLIRMAAGWTGEFVQIHGGRDALLGNDKIGADPDWTTPQSPGWAKPGSDVAKPDFGDPRGNKFGPLPGDWADYRGLYMHGNHVILSYHIGGAAVLDHPWYETHGEIGAYTRTLEVVAKDKSADPIVLAVCQSPAAIETTEIDGVSMTVAKNKDTVTAVALIGPGKVDFGLPNVKFTIKPGAKPTHAKLLVFRGKRDQLADFAALVKASPKPASLTALTKGGPKRWEHKLTTEGRLGKDDGPFVTDTITAPYDNPYNSILHFGGFDFFSNGRVAICTMEGDVWMVDGVDGDLDKITWTRYATGMYHPLGLKIVDDQLYVLCRDQIVRLHDLNGDDEADFYECFNDDCQVGHNSHEFATCLETDPQGNFFYMKGTNNGQTEHDSSVIKISKDGKTLTRYATGFRWPNGMGMGPDGTLTAADQQGNWVPSSRLDIVKKGGFYGYMSSHHRKTPPKTYDGPLCWIPHGVDNSCGGQVWVTSDKWGPLTGRMLHLSYGKCRMFLVLKEKVGDEWQGGVVQFDIPPFITGAMRGRFSPHDGQLYVTGLRGWQTSGPRDGALQRVRYTGKPIGMPLDLNVLSDGVRLTYAEPLDRELAEDVESYQVEVWNYRWAKAYGSREYSVANPDKVGHDKVQVTGAKLSKDGRTVTLKLAEVKPVMQMMIRFDLESAEGALVRGAVYNTIHQVGEQGAE